MIRYNSFLSVLGLPAVDACYSDSVSAANNWWGTTDAAVIASYITDGSDDFNCPGVLEFTPFLTGPHPNTPDPTPWHP